MLSYGLSLAVVSILTLFSIKYLLKGYFPSIHKTFVGALKLVRRLLKALVSRLGWFRTLFVIYLLSAVIFSLAILSNFGKDPLESLGALTLIWFPLVAAWKVRKRIKEWRERRYRLPGRRR